MSLRYRLHLLKKWLRFLLLDRVTPASVVPLTILLVRVDAIGDYILFRNFLPVIRTKFPDCHITLCGNDVWRGLAEAFDSNYVDDFIWINTSKFYSDASYRKAALTEIACKGFEVTIQPTYSRRLFFGDAIVNASGARTRIGSLGDLTNDMSFFKRIGDAYYTKLVNATDKLLFEFDRNAEFFDNLLGKSIAVHLSLPVRVAKRDSYVVFFPGASEPDRRWPPENFAKVAIFLRQQGRKIVIAGSAADTSTAVTIIQLAGSEGISDMTGKTSLVELCHIIAAGSLLVTNLSSALHIAAGTGTPAVCIFIDYQMGRFAPYPQDRYPYLSFVAPETQWVKAAKNDHLHETYRSFISQLNISEVTPDSVIARVGECL